MLAATKVKMSGSEKKSEQQDHIRHFLHKTCNSEVSGSFTLSSCKTTAKKCPKKKCAARAKLFFWLIRPTVFWLFSLPSPLSITRVYILFQLTIDTNESFAFSPG